MYQKRLVTLLVFALLLLPQAALAERNPANISTFAGSEEWGSADGKHDEAEFRLPTSVTIDAQGMMYIADTENHLIRQIDQAGNVRTVAGQIMGYDEYRQPVGGQADGTSAEARFHEPRGLTVDNEGNLYVADSLNGSIRKLDTTGHVSTLVSGLDFPSDLVLAGDGVLYVSETLQHRVLRVTMDGDVTVVSGGGYKEEEGVLVGAYRDGSREVAQFNEPTGLALAEDGTLFIADSGNQRIRSLTVDGNVDTVAGSGADTIAETGYVVGGFEDGLGEQARFHFPHGIDIAPDGSLYVADTYNHRVRQITPDGEVRTVAGLEHHGRELGNEMKATFNYPTDVLVLPNSNLAIVDQWNQRLQLVEWYQLPADVVLDGSIHLVWNDQLVPSDTPMENRAGRVMVPVRALAEALGFDVKWLKPSQTVILTKGEQEIRLQIGQAFTTDVAPYMKDDRMMIPVRAVAEVLEMQVKWLADSQTVLIRG